MGIQCVDMGPFYVQFYLKMCIIQYAYLYRLVIPITQNIITFFKILVEKKRDIGLLGRVFICDFLLR